MITSNTHNWFEHLWHSFTRWMSEPISFPGMTYDLSFKRRRTTK
jgi:hypothetical protein